MGESNALAVSPKSVIAEIIERLAAIKPEQFVEPDLGPDEHYHAVGEANDDIKRLFTLSSIARDEYNSLKGPFTATIDKLHKEMEGAKSNKDKVKALEAIVALEDDPETLRLHTEMSRKRNFYDIVSKIFWLELRRQYPEVDDKPCTSIRKNWTVGWCDEEDDDKIGLENLRALLGGGDRPETPDGFAEFLRSKFR